MTCDSGFTHREISHTRVVHTPGLPIEIYVLLARQRMKERAVAKVYLETLALFTYVS